MFIFRFVGTIEELFAFSFSDTIRTTAKFAVGAIASFFVGSFSGCDVIAAAAIRGVPAQAALEIRPDNFSDAVRAAAELVRVTRASFKFWTLSFCAPKTYECK